MLQNETNEISQEAFKSIRKLSFFIILDYKFAILIFL